jgi:hypothetical protein
MEACYGGTDVMERSCAVARGKDINTSVLGCAPSLCLGFEVCSKSNLKPKGFRVYFTAVFPALTLHCFHHSYWATRKNSYPL